MPLAGLLCGLAAGVIFRPAKTAGPALSIKSLTENRIAPPPFAPPAAALPSYEKLRSPDYTNLQNAVRLEQSALNLSPAEALKLALANGSDCRGPHPFAAKLLWYRAAQENPKQVLAAAKEIIDNQANALPLEGIFAAWVETDPAAALAAAEATPKYWNGNFQAADCCIAAWARRDPAACARALEGKNLTDSSMSSLLSAWTARDAPSALAWVEKRDRSRLPGAYREWSESDPVKAYEGALNLNSGALTADSDPVSVSCAITAHNRLIWRLPGLALQVACKDLTGLTGDYRPDSIASNMEQNTPGAGETFALALPQGAERDRAIGVIAGQAARRTELTHAKELFDNLSSPAKLWPAVSSVLVNLAQNDPEAGRAWLMDMKSQMEPKAFAAAAQDFNEHVVRVAPSMAVDP
jgi:hypothetical protein